MASIYHLLCFNCRIYLSLGKVYWSDEAGCALPETTLDGVFDEEGRAWHRRDELFGRAIEAFLLFHRNHELRFVPEGVDELLDTPESEVSPVDVGSILLDRSAGRPDAEVELENWRALLKKRGRGEAE